MEPRFETATERKLIGKRMMMSFSNNRTYELWRSLMPRRQEIQNSIGADLYSVEVYAPLYFDNFDPGAEFEKWAAIEVRDYQTIPDGMETMPLPAGLYAVFVHHGPASAGPKTYQHILGTWLPASDFVLDNRPHLAVMGEKYKNEDLNSEEELWIPVKPKAELK